MYNDIHALACMEAMHVRLGRLETMWDACYVTTDGEEPKPIKDTVTRLEKRCLSLDDELMSPEYMRLELISTFRHKDGVEAHTWMTTHLFGTIDSVQLMQVLYNKTKCMGVDCPTTVCQAAVKIEDRKGQKKTRYLTIKFRKATDEQEILLDRGKTIAEIELDNILRYKEVLGPEIWDLFPAFVMAIRLHDSATNSVWEGIGMKTLERVSAEARSTGGFYRAALHCLEKLHKAGASHGNPSLNSFMIKRKEGSQPQLCMTNFSTFRRFPLENWSVQRCYEATGNDLRTEYNEMWVTKVMVLMDYLKLFWIKNPRLPLHTERGDEAFNEVYLRKFHRNEARGEHIYYIAPWTPTRLLCFENNWDIHQMWSEVSSFVNYIKFFENMTLNDIATAFRVYSHTQQLQDIYTNVR